MRRASSGRRWIRRQSGRRGAPGRGRGRGRAVGGWATACACRLGEPSPSMRGWRRHGAGAGWTGGHRPGWPMATRSGRGGRVGQARRGDRRPEDIGCPCAPSALPAESAQSPHVLRVQTWPVVRVRTRAVVRVRTRARTRAAVRVRTRARTRARGGGGRRHRSARRAGPGRRPDAPDRRCRGTPFTRPASSRGDRRRAPPLRRWRAGRVRRAAAGGAGFQVDS